MLLHAGRGDPLLTRRLCAANRVDCSLSLHTTSRASRSIAGNIQRSQSRAPKPLRQAMGEPFMETRWWGAKNGDQNIALVCLCLVRSRVVRARVETAATLNKQAPSSAMRPVYSSGIPEMCLCCSSHGCRGVSLVVFVFSLTRPCPKYSRRRPMLAKAGCDAIVKLLATLPPCTARHP